MSYRGIFDAKSAASTLTIAFNFAASCATNETITSASTTATVYSGTDATPSAIIDGAAALNGKEITQSITAGVVGVTYLLTCTANTSLGQVLIQTGYLVVNE